MEAGVIVGVVGVSIGAMCMWSKWFWVGSPRSSMGDRDPSGVPLLLLPQHVGAPAPRHVRHDLVGVARVHGVQGFPVMLVVVVPPVAADVGSGKLPFCRVSCRAGGRWAGCSARPGCRQKNLRTNCSGLRISRSAEGGSGAAAAGGVLVRAPLQVGSPVGRRRMTL